MPSKSVLGHAPAQSGGAPKTGFSLDQSFTFTLSSGMLLPCFKAFVNVGETISGCPKFFMRSDPLLAPVMGDVDVFVDAFFVPMTHLCAPFDNWLFQISDLNSDFFDTSNFTDALPVVAPNDFQTGSIGSFADILVDSGSGYLFDTAFPDSPFEPFGAGLHRLLFHLGYNPQQLFQYFYRNNPVMRDYNADSLLPKFKLGQFNVDSPRVPPTYFAAYQKIYYDYYRDTEFENNNVKAYNFDSVFNDEYKLLPFTLRTEMFRLRYRNRKKDYFTAVHVNPLFSSVGMLPNAAQHLANMKDWLSSLSPTLSEDGNSVVIPNTGGSGYVNITGSASLNGVTGSDVGRWTLQDGSNLPTDMSNVLVRTMDSGSTLRSELDLQQIRHSHNVTGTASVSSSGSVQGVVTKLNLAALRSAFAYDKLLRITSRAGKHTDDQVLAHFGYKVPQGLSNEVYHLKSYHTVVHFGEVTATASTEVTNAAGDKVYTDVGEMSGKGYALLNSDERFKFTAPDFGVFMCIISCAPRYRYLGAVEKDGFKVYLQDFFKPSLDHLGQQPMFGYETGLFDNVTMSRSILNWQYRWMEDKIKFDRAAPVFATTSKNPWTFAYNAPVLGYDGDLLNWISATKVSPYDFNSVMVSTYQSGTRPSSAPSSPDNYVNYAKCYLRDPFTVDFAMDFKRVSEMSTFGEPSLGGID